MRERKKKIQRRKNQMNFIILLKKFRSIEFASLSLFEGKISLDAFCVNNSYESFQFLFLFMLNFFQISFTYYQIKFYVIILKSF